MAGWERYAVWLILVIESDLFCDLSVIIKSQLVCVMWRVSALYIIVPPSRDSSDILLYQRQLRKIKLRHSRIPAKALWSMLADVHHELADPARYHSPPGKWSRLQSFAQSKGQRSRRPKKNSVQPVEKKAHIKELILASHTDVRRRCLWFRLKRSRRSSLTVHSPQSSCQMIGLSETARTSHFFRTNQNRSLCGLPSSMTGRCRPFLIAALAVVPSWRQQWHAVAFITDYAGAQDLIFAVVSQTILIRFLPVLARYWFSWSFVLLA